MSRIGKPGLRIFLNLSGYLIAIISVALATWLKYLAQPSIIPADVPILYFLAIVPTAIFFGFGPSILVCILSFLAYAYFFIPPLHQFSLTNIGNAPILVIFLLVGVLFSYLASNLRKKNEEAVKEITARKQSEVELAKYRDHLEQIIQERTSELEKVNSGLKQEISEHKKTEEERGKIEEQFYKAFHSSPAALSISGLNDGTFVNVNQSFLDLFGYAREELVGRRADQLNLYDNSLERAEIVRLLQQQGKILNYEISARTKAGTEIRVLTSAEKFEIAGQAQIIWTTIDITERKKVEQIKDEFIGMVSHELKTPLTVIMGALSTAIDVRVSPEQSRELIGDAIIHSEILARLVDNLLELSRQQSDRLILQTQSVDVGEIVQNVFKKLQSKSVIHRLSSDVSPSLPHVLADPLRVDSILYNLIDNAIKYSPNGGEVRVFARQESDFVLVGVSDNGPGISKEDQARLFQRFERLGAEVNESIHGTGLGLRVCRILVEAHGGRIWVQSDKGSGSTFLFTLPLVKR